jgi:hypothetical protein
MIVLEQAVAALPFIQHILDMYRMGGSAFWKVRFFIQFYTTKDFLPAQCSLKDKPARTAFFRLLCVLSLLHLI